MNEYRDVSGRLTYNFIGIPSRHYSKITKTIVSEFGLEVESSKTTGLNEVFQDFKKDNKVVGLEWDSWSGYIVSAKEISTEPLAREIAGYIQHKFKP